VPIVPLVGASQVNEQDNMGSANVQGQSGEVQERTIPEQLIESVQYLKYDETKEFDIELTPRELGRVRVSIATDGERLNVHLIAESPSVAEIIKAELPVLRNVLAHQGLMFGQVNVGVGQEGNTNANLEYRTPTRSAYQVKGLEHTAEDEASHQFSRSDTYGTSARLHVDYVA
jgi:flagellar hook-length control protein FliK